MIKCETKNGGSYYFPTERIIVIQSASKDNMSIKFIKQDGEIGSMSITGFQLVKSGAVYKP